MNEAQTWWKGLSPKERGEWITRMYGYKTNIDSFVALQMVSARIDRLKRLTKGLLPIATVLDLMIGDLDKP